MADIQKASEAMGAVDLAARMANTIMVTQVVPIIRELANEGTITNTEALAWEKRLRSVGDNMEADALGVHSKLIRRAQKLGIDLPPLQNGAALLIDTIQKTPTPRGGGDR